MPLTEGQVQLRTLVMGAGTAYRIQSGFNPWSRRARADQGGARAWGHGSWSGAEWQAETVVPIRILVVEPSGTAAWLAAHQALLAAFAPSHTDLDLRFVVGGTEYLMVGRPRLVEPETDLIGLGMAYTQCAFVATDPMIYSGDEHEETIGLPMTSGGLIVPGDAGAMNLNPLFEVDASDWSVSGGAIVRSTAQSHQGAASLRLTPDGVSATVEASFSPVTVLRDTVYRLSAWVRCDVARNIVLQTNFSVNGVFYSSSNSGSLAVAATTWTYLEYLVTAPDEPGTVTVIGYIKMASTPPAGHVLYIDEAQIAAVAGLMVPFTIAATVVSGMVEVTNAGTADTGLTLRIDGPVVDPRISLLVDGVTQTLRLDLTLTAGQWLDIDTRAETVTLNGSASRRGQAYGDWPILPGSTSGELSWNAAAYEAAALLTVSWRDASY